MNREDVKFKTTVALSLEASHGTIKEENKVEVEVILRFRDGDRGSFEFYDEATQGIDWYAEGGLWFKGMSLTEYDGVFSLASFIEDKLVELGYTIDL